MVKTPFEPLMNMKLIPKYIKVQNDQINVLNVTIRLSMTVRSGLETSSLVLHVLVSTTVLKTGPDQPIQPGIRS